MLGAPAFPDDPTIAASGRTHLLGRPFKWAAVLVHLPLMPLERRPCWFGKYDSADDRNVTPRREAS